MTAENPELRAKPVEAKDLQKASPEELKKIREQAEADSGVKRNLEDPKYVAALNKGWAEHYRDQGHPLVDKLLAFEGNPEEAVAAIKKIQRDLKVKDDGVIGAETLRAYHSKIEADEKAGVVGPDPFSDTSKGLVEINVLGQKEKQEKLKTHAEKLAQAETNTVAQDINGKTVQVTEENGEKVFMGTEENSNKYYNPESGEYETKEGRAGRIKTQDAEKALKRTERLDELKKIGENGETYGTDFEGQSIIYNADKKVWEATGGENAGKTLNLETGKFELTTEQVKKHGEEFTTKLRSGTEAQLKDLKDVHGNPVTVTEQDDKRVALGTGENEGKIYQPETGTYKLTTDQIKKHGEEFATKLRSGKEADLKDMKDVHGNPVTVTEQDDKRVALGTGENEGKIYQPETGTYEATQEEQEVRERKEESENIGDILDSLTQSSGGKAPLDMRSAEFRIRSIKDLPLDQLDQGYGWLHGKNDRSDEAEEGVKKLEAQISEWVSKNPERAKDTTLGELVEMRKNPLKAAQKFATNTAQELPLGLGDRGIKYQRQKIGGNDLILAYGEDSEVPKLFKGDREVKIEEYFENMPNRSKIPLGPNRDIVLERKRENGTETVSYVLETTSDDRSRVVATREIKEGKVIEQESEAPLMAANIASRTSE